MKCRICNSECTPAITQLGLFQCSNCHSWNREKIPHWNWYKEVNYWYTNDWLLTYQKSLMVWFKEYLLNYPLVEFGAADGDMLALTKHYIQWKYGEKPDTYYNELVEMARKSYHFTKYLIGPVEDYYGFFQELPKVNFLAINVVEHLEQPFEFIRYLCPGSRIIVVTDDGDDAFYRNEMLIHLEHSICLTEQAFHIVEKLYKCKIVKYIRTPWGITITILEKQMYG